MRIRYRWNDDGVTADCVTSIKDFWHSMGWVWFIDLDNVKYKSSEAVLKDDFDKAASELLGNGFADLSNEMFGVFDNVD